MDGTTADSSLLRQQNNPYAAPHCYSPDVPSPSLRMSSDRKPLRKANTSDHGAELDHVTAPSPSNTNEGLAIRNIGNIPLTFTSNDRRGTPAPIDIDGNSSASTSIPPRTFGAVRSPSGVPHGSPNTPASIDQLSPPTLSMNPGTSGTLYSGDPFLSPSPAFDGRFAGKLEGPYGKEDEYEGDLGHVSFDPYHASSDLERLRGMDSSASIIRPSGTLPPCVPLSNPINCTNLPFIQAAPKTLNAKQDMGFCKAGGIG